MKDIRVRIGKDAQQWIEAAASDNGRSVESLCGALLELGLEHYLRGSAVLLERLAPERAA